MQILRKSSDFIKKPKFSNCRAKIWTRTDDQNFWKKRKKEWDWTKIEISFSHSVFENLASPCSKTIARRMDRHSSESVEAYTRSVWVHLVSPICTYNNTHTVSWLTINFSEQFTFRGNLKRPFFLFFLLFSTESVSNRVSHMLRLFCLS